MTGTGEPDAGDVAERWMFLRALKNCQVVTEQQVNAVVDRHPEATLSQLKAVLVGDGLLTPYQVKRVADRDTDGLVVGQYQLQAELGRGGFGVVYLARHALMNRTVALKVIGEQWTRDPAGREYFLREVAGCTRLSHPNITMPYDAGEVNGRLYLAMEYVDGPTLDSYLTACGPLSPPALVAVLTQTAEALRHADERGVVHRDLKPANILLASRVTSAGETGAVPFTVKVIDFGLARFFHREVAPVGTLMCEAGAIVGTPAYMAPEQADDFHAADVRSDLYALGCTAYQAATGRVPFTGRNAQQILEAAANGRVAPVTQWRADLPGWLVEVIHTLMARNPEDRFQTPAELLSALAGWSAPVTCPDLSITPLPALLPAPLPEPSLPDASDVGRLTVTPDPTAVILPAEAEPVEDFAPWWQEWHRQVGRLAAGRPADVNDREYRTLHRTLLRAITGAMGGPAAEHRHGLLAAVEPWVSLKSLTALDRRTLGDVWAACQRLNAGVGQGKRRSLLGWW